MSLRGSLLALVVVTLPAAAHAHGSYVDQIPNGSEAGSCDLCHGGVGFTSFGEQARDALDGDTITWSALFCADADGDGQSNGGELGDPCGVWSVGSDAPRATDVSGPHDAASMAADPDVGCPDGESPPAECAGGVGDDESLFGCTATRGGAPLLLFAVVALGLTLRRRRA